VCLRAPSSDRESLEVVPRPHSPLTRAIRRLARATILRLSIRLFPRERIEGVELAYLLMDDEWRSLFMTKVGRSLELIRTFDACRFERIRRQLDRIALVPRGGEYVDTAIRTYFMDVPTLSGRDDAYLATKIVHESTHIRIAACGIRTTERNRSRVEHICINQQLAFAARLPSPQRDEVSALVEAAAATRWWETESGADRILEQIEAYGAPKMLISWARRLSGRDRRSEETAR